ncbi:MAG: S4 domain-containing protein [Candidatus Pacearchaeota archaeon]|jgi:small subunit ribosomal protein S4e
MHLKRNNIPKFWPIERKGTKYLSVPSHNQTESIPLVVVIRDIFKLARNKKEIRRMLKEKQIKINGKEIRDVNYPISLFDVLSFSATKKNYRAELSNLKKITFKEITEKESETRVYKVMGKKILPKNITQVNLINGRNVNTKDKINTGDSVVISFKDNKIIKVLTLEKGREASITEGKHAGNRGKIEEIVFRGGKSIAKINSENGKINVWVKNLIITG